MSSLAKRLTSLATVFALCGFPAALSACMALCLPGVADTTVSHEHRAPVEHAAHASSTPAVALGHSHHGSPAVHEPAASADGGASSSDSSNARLTATRNPCCPGGQVAFVAGPGVERIGPPAFDAAPMVSRVSSFLVMTSVLGASPPSPPVPPPSPTRASLVLRI